MRTLIHMGPAFVNGEPIADEVQIFDEYSEWLPLTHGAAQAANYITNSGEVLL